jgi:D-alanyl-D-alanine carboxypeptidase
MGGLLTHRRLLWRWLSATLAFPLAACLVALASACGDNNSEDGATPTSSSAVHATRSPSGTSPLTGAPSPTPGPPPAAPATLAPTQEPPPAPTQPPPPGQPPGGVSLLTVVDKQTALPSGYVPPGLVTIGPGYIAPGFSGTLRAEAYQALVRMLSDAYTAGSDIYVRSAYRSYAEQAATFAYWVSVLGEEEARRVSAEAGHSEHQLGTAVDLTDATVGFDLVESFGATASGQWLMANAHLYGFALSYPAGAEPITGYAYEPWHWRYIGVERAAAWKASGLTLVEYLRGVA